MKAHVQKLVGLAALGLTLLTTPVPTWAGYRFTPGVDDLPEPSGRLVCQRQHGRYALQCRRRPVYRVHGHCDLHADRVSRQEHSRRLPLL